MRRWLIRGVIVGLLGVGPVQVSMIEEIKRPPRNAVFQRSVFIFTGWVKL